MGVPFVTCDNIGSSKNILLAEFIHLKATSGWALAAENL
jgi:hypothetical protein